MLSPSAANRVEQAVGRVIPTGSLPCPRGWMSSKPVSAHPPKMFFVQFILPVRRTPSLQNRGVASSRWRPPDRFMAGQPAGCRMVLPLRVFASTSRIRFFECRADARERISGARKSLPCFSALGPSFNSGTSFLYLHHGSNRAFRRRSFGLLLLSFGQKFDQIFGKSPFLGGPASGLRQ